MRNYRLRQIKKEIRVLGLAAKPAGDDCKLHVVGVVFRGRLWLDGVMRTTTYRLDITKDVIEMITNSPHHPQIRVILLHGDLLQGGACIDPCTLSSGISRPVIALKFDEGSFLGDDECVSMLMLKQGVTQIPLVSVSLKSHVALRVMETASLDDAMPEALRVAELVASALVEGVKT